MSFVNLGLLPKQVQILDAKVFEAAQLLHKQGWRVCAEYLDVDTVMQDMESEDFAVSLREAITTLPPGTVVLTAGIPIYVEAVPQLVCHHSPRSSDGAIAVPYWFQYRGEADPTERHYDVSFQGSTVSNEKLRRDMSWGFMKHKEHQPASRIMCRLNTKYFYSLTPEEQLKLDQSYWELLNSSRFVLCPRGDHFNSVRFYEALSAGCIPILAADQVRLPLEETLPWHDMIVRVPEASATNWSKYLTDWRRNRTPQELVNVSIGNQKTFKEWLHWTNLSKQLIVERVEKAIRLAEVRYSRLTRYQLEMEGMSSAKVRHFLNNLHPQSYLEVGVWKGSTFIASCFKNQVKSAIAIDNFSQFQTDEGLGKSLFLSRVQEHLGGVGNINSLEGFRLYDRPFEEIAQPLDTIPVDVYLYDGAHDYESQRRGITQMWKRLAPEAIIVVDDANMPGVVEATREGVRQCVGTILRDWHLPARWNGDTEQWWNGLYVLAVSKESK